MIAKKHSPINRKNKAFTLLELAVVLVVVALVAGVGVSISKDMIETSKEVATNKRMDEIEKAIFTFMKKNGRIPCPGDATYLTSNANYGVEATQAMLERCQGGAIASTFNTSSTYMNKAAEGVVPVATLGLPREFMYDGWGRKFAYAANPVMTDSTYSTKAFPPKHSTGCADNTAIMVKDASGANRSTSAIYALISYGKNGHGGYLSAGTRFSSGSTNTDELTNCHCTNAAANGTYSGNYVQRSQNLNSKTAASYFDDIVRYKERWQLTTEEDLLEDDGYRGPDLAIGYQLVGSGTVYLYKNKCSRFIKQADLSPLPTDKPLGVAFTTGNKHLLTYSGLGCNLYKISAGGTLTNLSSAFATACPYNSTAVMDLSNNGYLAISSGTSSAVINLWKQSGDKFVALTSLTHSAASVAELSFSPDAKMLAVRSATNTSRIYKRKGDTFSAAAADITQPANLSVTNTPLTIVFSPDGKFLADIELNTGDSRYYVNSWVVIGGDNPSFSQMTSRTPSTTNSVDSLIFSHDRRILQVTGVYNGTCLIEHSWPSLCGNSGNYYGGGWTSGFAASGGKTYGAFSKGGYYYVMTRLDDTGLPSVSKSYFRTAYRPMRRFEYGYSTGVLNPSSSPSHGMDRILFGATGGPVAFSK